MLMSTRSLDDQTWSHIYQFLQASPGIYIKNEASCRQFVEGVYWITRTGAQWRDLPPQFGKWNTVFKRFARWSDKGIWHQMFEHFQQEPDMEWLIIDSTTVRAHPSAAGAPKKTVGQPSKHWGEVAADSAPNSM